MDRVSTLADAGTDQTYVGANALGPAEDESLKGPKPPEMQILNRCVSVYAGQYLYPAHLTQTEIELILERVSKSAVACQKLRLFLEGRNVPSDMLDGNTVSLCNQRLHEAVAGKYYRFAAGSNRYHQLWVVEPD